MILVDTLSRATLKNTTHTIPENETIKYIHSVVHHLPVSDEMLKKIRHETNLDPIMQAISKYLPHGWPNEIRKIDTPVHPYYKIRNELSEYEGLNLKGSRIVIPITLRKRMEQVLHIFHLGIERTKVNARGTMYWPNINTDIENMVENCTECQIYRNKLEKETLLQHTVPEKPWSKVATDLFHCFNQNYLILVDYTLKYFEVCQLQNLTSEEVIPKMNPSFSRFGIPEEIVSDNGSQYTSREFREFAKIYNFRHKTSRPEYPQRNGLGERTIQTAKKALKKARYCLEDY